MTPMRRFTADPFFEGVDALLDPEAVEAMQAPDRLSRDEGRVAAGPDWSRTRPMLDEDTDND